MVDEENSLEESKKVARIAKEIKDAEGFYANIFERCKQDQKIANGIQSSQYDDIDQKVRGNDRAEFQFPMLDKYVERIQGTYNNNQFGIDYSAYDSSQKQKAILLSGIVKGILDRSNYGDVNRGALRNSTTVGYGWKHVTTEYANESDDSLEVNIMIENISDYTSVLQGKTEKPDGSDADWRAWVDYVSPKFAKEKYDYNVELDSKTPLFDSKNMKSEDTENKVPIVVHYEKIKKHSNIYINPENSEETSKERMDGWRFKEKTETFIRCTKLCGNTIIYEQDMIGVTRIPIVPSYGLPVYVDSKFQYVGVIHRPKHAQKLFNYAGSAIAERLALAPKSNYIIPESAMGPYEELWKNAPKSNVPFLIWRDWDPKSGPNGQGRQIAPPQKQDVSVNISDLASSLKIFAETMEYVTGIPQEGIGGDGNIGETAEAALLKAKSSETILSTFYENLAASDKEIGRVILEMLSAFYDTKRSIQVEVDGKMEMQEIDFEELDLIPSEFDVSVSSGPLLATQRKDTLRQLFAIANTAGEKGLGLLPAIIENSDIEDRTGYLEQWANMVAEETMGSNQGNMQQLMQQNQQMAQQNQALEMQLNAMNQELIEGKMSLEKEKIDSQTELMKTSMQNQNKLQVKALELQGKSQLQAQKAADDLQLQIQEEQAEMEQLLANGQFDLAQIRAQNLQVLRNNITL